MKKLHILVVDESSTFRRHIFDELSKREDVACCHCAGGGGEAISLLKENNYDVVVTDLILPQTDGFDVIEHATAGDKKPLIIVVTALATETMIRRACEAGAYYYILKPVDMDVLARRITEKPTSITALRDGEQLIRPAKSMTRSLDERISSVFLAAGIPAHIKGYTFLREAVRQVYEDSSKINAITKELYPSVAAMFDTSPSKVERAIRHAIEVAWARGKIENINGIFGYTIFAKQEKPTNGEFIALVADKLRMDDLTRMEQDRKAF